MFGRGLYFAEHPDSKMVVLNISNKHVFVITWYANSTSRLQQLCWVLIKHWRLFGSLIWTAWLLLSLSIEVSNMVVSFALNRVSFKWPNKLICSTFQVQQAVAPSQIELLELLEGVAWSQMSTQLQMRGWELEPGKGWKRRKSTKDMVKVWKKEQVRCVLEWSYWIILRFEHGVRSCKILCTGLIC